MGFFKRATPNPLQIAISAPDTVNEDNVFLDIAVTLQSQTSTIKPTIKARLRADLTNKKKARGAAEYYLLGEAEYGAQISVVPDQTEKIEIKIPLDFSPMALFDIPVANMALASPEMQAAMTEAQEIGHLYAFSIEVITKTDDHEFATRKPIELIRPDSTRVASFN
jgi:hypothetical protein